MAESDLQQIRRRFNYCCGYCGVSETDTGGELTVDHYEPRSAGGGESSQNLIYACFKCNQFKSAFLPTPEDLANGRRVLHPLQDDFSDHLRETPATGELESLTETGRFHIALLHLNRPSLIAHRKRRRLISLAKEKLQ
ncbi:MAG: HNH endonuclease, partial [Planctomycetota bacterium]|nr:HNH endonuclease [Planctomycetota bacterium]